MPRKKTKKKAKVRRPTKKKNKLSKINFLKKNRSLYILGFVLFFLVICLSILLAKTKKETSAPLVHLVASVSAQKGPIKIDPDFSYKEGELIKESPKKTVIPSLQIDIPVIDAEIIDGYWETASNSASFGLGSAYPEDVGNTVIFAHAKEGLFGNLRNVKAGDNIYILTDSDWYPYQVEEVKTVLPDQVEVVSPTGDRRLTLYTCTGYQDFYRLVVVAKPVN